MDERRKTVKRRIPELSTEFSKRTRRSTYKKEDGLDFSLIFKRIDDLKLIDDPKIKLEILKSVCALIDDEIKKVSKPEIISYPEKKYYSYSSKIISPITQSNFIETDLFRPNISISDLRTEYKITTLDRSKTTPPISTIGKKFKDGIEKEMIKIMTFNIQNMNSPDRLDELLQQIIFCDIICLQEVSHSENSHFNYIIDKMKNYGYDYVIEKDDNKISQLLCTFYNTNKLDLRNTRFTTIEKNYVLETEFSRIKENVNFYVYNVYLNHSQNELESKIKIIQYIEQNTKPFILCGDFNSVRETDYSDKKQWEWIVKNRKQRNVTDPESKTFSEITAKFLSCINNTKEYITKKIIYTSWSMRVIDHIFLCNNKNWKIQNANIYYPVFKYKNDTKPLSDHLPLVADIFMPTNSQSYFVSCLDKLSLKKEHKNVIVEKGSILYHGTGYNISDNMLYDKSFLSNRLKFPNHWAVKKTSGSYEFGKVPTIYKFSTNRDIKLLLLDANPSYECLEGYCVGEGSNTKKLKCSNSFQCVEQPSHKGFGHLYYKDCADANVLKLLNKEDNRSLNQDEFLNLLCLYTDYDGFKWTQHEQEIALCKPNKVLNFEGVIYKKLKNKPVERDQDIELLLEEKDEVYSKTGNSPIYYTNWSK